MAEKPPIHPPGATTGEGSGGGVDGEQGPDLSRGKLGIVATRGDHYTIDYGEWKGSDRGAG